MEEYVNVKAGSNILCLPLSTVQSWTPENWRWASLDYEYLGCVANESLDQRSRDAWKLYKKLTAPVIYYTPTPKTRWQKFLSWLESKGIL